MWAPDYLNEDHPVKHTEEISLEKINIPTAIIVGKYDKIADPVDASWISQNLPNLVLYKEIDGGHATYMVGKDMSFFTQDVMGLIKKYQPLPTMPFLH